MAVLEREGNAFDAAVAAGFVLQVVEPHFNGPGGDVSIVAHRAGTEDAVAVCGQGPMPMAATPERFAELGLDQIPGSGLLPACVPGAMGAWLRLLAEFGTKRLAEVLAPAIGYAESGFPVLPEMARAIETMSPLFNTEWPSSAQVYLPHGAAPPAGSRFSNPMLAETYRRLLGEAEAASADREEQLGAAHRAFYEGFAAEAIDKFVSAGPVLDATGRRNPGLLTGQDLAGWRPEVDRALHQPYRGVDVFKPGPWSQGPVFAQQLALLEGFPLGDMAPYGAEHLHTVVECAKLAFADREAWYGDPAFTDVPMDVLLSAEYNERRRSLVTGSANHEFRPGAVGGRVPRVPERPPQQEIPAADAEWLRQLGNGLPTVVELSNTRNDTCSVTVADRYGNMVAAVPSGGWLKSSPVIPGLGFSLGTRGQTMHLAGGHPNSLEPGKRPRTTLSPTVVLREGNPVLAFGTPGGDQQDQYTLEFFLAVIDFGLDLQAAVEAPTFRTGQVPSSFVPHEFHPGFLSLESGCSQEVFDELRRRGHVAEPGPEFSMGKVCAVGTDLHNELLLAAASPRGRQPYAVCR
ncbi:gamma-glutamyltransferase family protein [Saccharopolyspora sp. SCSIO 74807]|uniref:gamma-glutamyltransferase family protein n=2 Tax=unclassified Saccharopolyspora TaxID=2646250 RepID=UPI00387EC922